MPPSVGFRIGSRANANSNFGSSHPFLVVEVEHHGCTTMGPRQCSLYDLHTTGHSWRSWRTIHQCWVPLSHYRSQCQSRNVGTGKENTFCESCLQARPTRRLFGATQCRARFLLMHEKQIKGSKNMSGFTWFSNIWLSNWSSLFKHICTVDSSLNSGKICRMGIHSTPGCWQQYSPWMSYWDIQDMQPARQENMQCTAASVSILSIQWCCRRCSW